MFAAQLDRLGNWNPQLLRELKGRLTLRNLAIVISLSLLGQVLLVLFHLGQLPSAYKFVNVQNLYCTGPKPYPYSQPNCLVGVNGSFIINWSLWWQDLFILLSIFSLGLLLVAGSYLIINDLSKEERQGTLNFIRLSPQSAETILWGKLLGVPVLFYCMLLLTLPLSIYAGLAGQLSPATLVCYYSIVAASSLFFYSLSLLFGLVTTWLGALQAWLGSGTFSLILMSYTLMNTGGAEMNNFAAWPRILFPTIFIPGLETAGLVGYSHNLQLSHLQWFYVPIGLTTIGLTLFALALYGVGTLWVWRVLRRRFRSLNTTILTKAQSYTLTIILQLVTLGFLFQDEMRGDRYQTEMAWVYLLVLNLMLGLFLIAALMPQRTPLVEWARYRYIRRADSFTTPKAYRQGWLRTWLQELLWGEKSPAFLAIGINFVLLAIVQLPWIGLAYITNTAKPLGAAMLGMGLSLSILLIYAAIVQLYLLSTSPRRAVWAAGTIVLAITVPPIVLGILGLAPGSYGGAPFWLFTAFPWMAVESTLGRTAVFACVSHGLAIVLLNVQFARRLRRLGESASKALLTPAPPV